MAKAKRSVAKDPADLDRPQATAAPRARLEHSTCPDFAAKLDDVVGLYIDPPRHAVVFSIDEKARHLAGLSGL